MIHRWEEWSWRLEVRKSRCFWRIPIYSSKLEFVRIFEFCHYSDEFESNIRYICILAIAFTGLFHPVLVFQSNATDVGHGPRIMTDKPICNANINLYSACVRLMNCAQFFSVTFLLLSYAVIRSPNWSVALTIVATDLCAFRFISISHDGRNTATIRLTELFRGRRGENPTRYRSATVQALLYNVRWPRVLDLSRRRPQCSKFQR